MVKFIYKCAERDTWKVCNGAYCIGDACIGTYDPEMACKDAGGKPIVIAAYIVDVEANFVRELNPDELHDLLTSGKIDLESPYDIPDPSIENL